MYIYIIYCFWGKECEGKFRASFCASVFSNIFRLKYSLSKTVGLFGDMSFKFW